MALLPLLCPPGISSARGDWEQNFEEGQPTWLPTTPERQYRILDHRRGDEERRSGSRAETFAFEARSQQPVLLAYPVPPAMVIDDLQISVWVKSYRPGVRLQVRVALPREKHPQSGEFLTTILLGDALSKPGQWEELRLTDIPKLLERQAQLLRAQGRQVDTRGAFVSQVLLELQMGAGSHRIWVDDLRLLGNIRPGQVGPLAPPFAPPTQGFSSQTNNVEGPQPNAPLAGSPRSEAENDFAGFSTTANASRDANPGNRSGAPRTDMGLNLRRLPEAVLRGTSLEVGGQTLFARVWEHHGEPLAQIKGLGFQAVRLDHSPTPAERNAAAQLGLGLIAPPPELPARSQVAGSLTPVVEQDSPQGAAPEGEWDAVWAWDLGNQRSRADLPGLQKVSQAARSLDPLRDRLFLAHVSDGLADYGRLADIFLIGSPEPRQLPLSEEYRLLSAQVRLARPGAALWASLPTEPAQGALYQARALNESRIEAPSLSLLELRRRAHLAIAAGCRGLVFRSQHAISKRQEPAFAAALELLNLELNLLEPWAAASQYATTASCSDTRFVGAVLQANHSYLVLPLPTSRFGQAALPSARSTYVIPGVPESYRPFELTAAGFKPAENYRTVPGGMQVTLSQEDPGLMLVVLRGDDARVLSYFRRQLDRAAPRAVELARQVAAADVVAAETLATQLRGTASAAGAASPSTPLAAAAQAPRRMDTAFSQGNLAGAWNGASVAMLNVESFNLASLTQAKTKMGGETASPFTVHPGLLPNHQLLLTHTVGLAAGQNILPGGELEDLAQLTALGWEHFRHAGEGLITVAELLPNQPHQGRQALHLQVSARPGTKPAWLESPPLWIQTPALAVRPKSLLRIEGWVKVPKPLEQTSDGLVVFDSLTGAAMGARFQQTPDWQPFVLYRVADNSGRLRVTCALSGVGEAWIDDLRVIPLETSGRLVPSRPFNGPPTSSRPQTIRPVTTLPATNRSPRSGSPMGIR